MVKTVCEKGKVCIHLTVTKTRIEYDYPKRGGIALSYYCNNKRKFKLGKFLTRVEKYKMCKHKQTNKLEDFTQC